MMKRIAIFLLIYGISLFLSISVISLTLKYNSTSFKDFTAGNVLKNSDFKNGFKEWKYQDNISITNIDRKASVHIKGSNNKQTRFQQDIEVVSGQVYCVQFRLKGLQTGAFAIRRDLKTTKEEYLYCTGKANEKTYTWEINPIRTGKNTIYFSAYKEGDYYFSDIKVVNKSIKDPFKVLLLVSITILSSIILSVILFFINKRIVFYSVVLLLSILPVIKINKSDISINENRNLAKFKSIFEGGKINLSFGKEFNDYLNDRFFGRQFIMSWYRDLKYTVDRRYENSTAIQGKDGWLFEKFDPNMFSTSGDADKLILDKMIQLQEQCNNKGIKVVFASIPEKNSVYGEYNYSNSVDERLAKKLAQNEEVRFLFLLDEFLKDKDNGYLYFKDDHHYTERGAFYYAQKLIDCCKQDFPVLIDLKTNDFVISNIKNTYNDSITFAKFNEKQNVVGSIRKLLNFDKESYPNTSYYEAYRHKTFRIPKTELASGKPSYSIYRNEAINNHVKIMVLGDSNIAFLVPFLTSAFSECLFLQTNEHGNAGWYLKAYSQILDANKPDIIFVIVRSLNLKRWIKLSQF